MDFGEENLTFAANNLCQSTLAKILCFLESDTSEARHDSQAVSLEPSLEHSGSSISDGLQSLVLRPSSPWPSKRMNYNVHKSCLFHDFLGVVAGDKLHACILTRRYEEIEVLIQSATSICIVITAELAVFNFANFDEASGADMVKHLTDKFCMIFDTIFYHPVHIMSTLMFVKHY